MSSAALFPWSLTCFMEQEGRDKVLELCIAQQSPVLPCAHCPDCCASSPQTQAESPAVMQAWSSYS